MGPVIRPMVSKDTESVVAVSLAADSLFTGAEVMLPPDDPRHLLDHAEHVLVAEVEGRVEGLAATVTLDGAAHLEQLAVHPDHGRRGVGGVLLEAVCSQALDRGHDRVTLTTFRDLAWNGPWYEQRGFRVFPRRGWGTGLIRRWGVEEEAGIMVLPRVAMVRYLGSFDRPCAGPDPWV